MFLRNSHLGRARAFVEIERHEESLPDWEQAATLSAESEQMELRMSRMMACLRADHFEKAVEDASAFLKEGELVKVSWDATVWYNFACVYAVASGRLPDDQLEYSDHAMELLQKSIKLGFGTIENAAHIAKDPDLDALRDRDDFKTLMESLPKAAEPDSAM